MYYMIIMNLSSFKPECPTPIFFLSMTFTFRKDKMPQNAPVLDLSNYFLMAQFNFLFCNTVFAIN